MLNQIAFRPTAEELIVLAPFAPVAATFTYTEDIDFAIEVTDQDKNNIDGIITILTTLGNIAFTQDDLSKAFQYYKRGIALAEDGNFQKRLVRLHFNIGAVLTKTGQYAWEQNQKKYREHLKNRMISLK